MMAPARPIACTNMNHRRADAPVSHCPQCGAMVNRAITPPACTEQKHALSRRRQSVFCVDCGAALIVGR